MAVITDKIDNILKEKKLTRYKLGKLIKYKRVSTLYGIIDGKQTMSKSVVRKIARILEISQDEILGWILTDKYSQETLKSALQLQKEHAKSGEKVVTIKMNELMDANNLNVCAFARALEYNQGLLSQVKLGNASISKKLMPKLVAFSGFSEDEINSWLVADSSPPKILRFAVG